jgi:hypothetical protein
LKKAPKVALPIERRKRSLATVKGVASRQGPRLVHESARPASEFGLPSTCPACGSARVLSLATALAEQGFTLELLEKSAAGRRIHMGQSPSGEWWVCRQSLQTK